jgi:PPOX class probable F420-dependent enzyme
MGTYPQKPPLTEAELETFLREAPVARLGTVNPDGTIHLAALYFGYENGDIVFGTQDVTNKVRNIQRNPVVTVLIDDVEPDLRGVLIYGHAQLDYEDVIPKRVTIFEKYMSRETALQRATGLASNFTPVIIRVRPDRVTSWDYSKDGMIETGTGTAE